MSPARVELATLPTPLVRAPRLEQALAAGPLYIKRDDLTGFSVAGNKARALEFLLGAALAAGSDVFVAAGSPSSNFCAAAAMAAATVGLDCDLLFAGPPPPVPSVNIELARAAGARLIFDAVATREELDAAVLLHADDLRDSGRRPYAVPRGGATAVGALGYASAAREFSRAMRPGRDRRPDGGGGNRIRRHPGRSAGRSGGIRPAVAGDRGLGQPACRRRRRPDPGHVQGLCRTARYRRSETLPTSTSGICAAPGSASPRRRTGSAPIWRRQHEGLLLDDYYGAKAMTLFRTVLAAEAPTPAVFWHTGGIVAALAALLRGAPA